MVKPSSEHWTVKKMHLLWNSMKNAFIISLPSYVTYLWVLLYNDEIFLTLLLNLEDDVVMSDDLHFCVWLNHGLNGMPHTLHIALCNVSRRCSNKNLNTIHTAIKLPWRTKPEAPFKADSIGYWHFSNIFQGARRDYNTQACLFNIIFILNTFEQPLHPGNE